MEYSEIKIGHFYKNKSNGDRYEVTGMGRLKTERGEWTVGILYKAVDGNDTELYIRGEGNFCRTFNPLTDV